MLNLLELSKYVRPVFSNFWGKYPGPFKAKWKRISNSGKMKCLNRKYIKSKYIKLSSTTLLIFFLQILLHFVKYLFIYLIKKLYLFSG